MKILTRNLCPKHRNNPCSLISKRQTAQQINGKDKNGYFFQEGTQIAIRHMKRCSALLIFRDRPIRSPMSITLHWWDWPSLNISKKSLERVWREGTLPTLLLGMWSGTCTRENTMEVLKKYKHKIIWGHSNPTPGNPFRESQNFKRQRFPCDHGGTRYHSKDMEQTMCGRTDEWIRKTGAHRHKATSLGLK